MRSVLLEIDIDLDVYACEYEQGREHLKEMFLRDARDSAELEADKVVGRIMNEVEYRKARGF